MSHVKCNIAGWILYWKCKLPNCCGSLLICSKERRLGQHWTFVWYAILAAEFSSGRQIRVNPGVIAVLDKQVGLEKNITWLPLLFICLVQNFLGGRGGRGCGWCSTVCYHMGRLLGSFVGEQPLCCSQTHHWVPASVVMLRLPHVQVKSTAPHVVSAFHLCQN